MKYRDEEEPCLHENIDVIELYCPDCENYVCWNCRVETTPDDLTQCDKCDKENREDYSDFDDFDTDY